jgi:hypothetical protein
MNPHLELLLAIVVQLIPLLLLFFLGNIGILVAAVIRRMNILLVIVTL